MSILNDDAALQEITRLVANDVPPGRNLRILYDCRRLWEAFETGIFATLSILVCCSKEQLFWPRFAAASIWEILSLTVLLTRGLRRTSTLQLAEHGDCIEKEAEIPLYHMHQSRDAERIWLWLF